MSNSESTPGDAHVPDALVPTYGSYLRLDALLSAQSPPDYAQLQEGDPLAAHTRPLAHKEELLFIIVHQVYELWFKLILHELGFARDLLGRREATPKPETVAEQDIPRIWSAINRVNEIFRIAVDQFRVMETMAPSDFLSFRDLITPASGFQSAQFRELEILSGLSEDLRMDFEGVPYAAKLSPHDRDVIQKRSSEMTLKGALYDWLARTPIERVSPDFAESFLRGLGLYLDEQARQQAKNPNLAESQKLAALKRFESQKENARAYLLDGDPDTLRAHQAFLFIATYHDEPLLQWPYRLIESLVEFEQGFRQFRFRHARMVERMIGLRTGTGGSPGVAYLDSTSRRYRIFGALLEARGLLLPPEFVPKLPATGLLGFRFDAS